MKHSGQCPKCHSVDVIEIKGNKFNQNQVIRLGNWGRQAVIDRFICTACGYTEEWVQLTTKFDKWADKARDSGQVNSDFV